MSGRARRNLSATTCSPKERPTTGKHACAGSMPHTRKVVFSFPVQVSRPNRGAFCLSARIGGVTRPFRPPLREPRRPVGKRLVAEQVRRAASQQRKAPFHRGAFAIVHYGVCHHVRPK